MRTASSSLSLVRAMGAALLGLATIAASANAASYTWSGASSTTTPGNWSDTTATGWNTGGGSDYPNARYDIVYTNTSTNAATQGIVIDALATNATVGTLNMGGNGYGAVVSGSNALTCDNGAYCAQLNLNGGQTDEITAPVVLAGNLWIDLNSTSPYFDYISGNISESGGAKSLTFLSKAGGAFGNPNTSFTLSGTNTYTGGTNILTGQLVFSTINAVAGTGRNVFVDHGAVATLGTALTQAFLDRLATDSTGVVAGSATTSANLDFSSLPNVYLGGAYTAGAAINYSGTITPANGVYRLADSTGNLSLYFNKSGGNQFTGSNSLVVSGYAGGLDSTSNLPVIFGDWTTTGYSQNYTGGTTLTNLAQLKSTLSGSGGTTSQPFGSGSINLESGALILAPADTTLDTALTGATNTGKTFSFSQGSLSLTRNGAHALTFTVGDNISGDTLVRNNHGTLQIAAGTGTVGTDVKFIVAAANTQPAVVTTAGGNTMTDAYYLVSGDFATYGSANGFAPVTYDASDLSTSTSTTTVNTSSTAWSGALSAYALKLTGASLTNSNIGDTLTLGDGAHTAGLIISSSSDFTLGSSSKASTLAFAPGSDGIIYANVTGALGIYSKITGTNGLTIVPIFAGSSAAVTLYGDNSGLSGGLYLYAGATSYGSAKNYFNVTANSASAIGTSTNPVYLMDEAGLTANFSGSFSQPVHFVGQDARLAMTGPYAGTLYLEQSEGYAWVSGGTITGNITGAGKLGIYGATTISNPSNDWQGGLVVEGNTAAIAKLGASNVIPDGAGKGNVTIYAAGTLDLNGQTETINGLAGLGTVDSTAGSTAGLTVGGGDATASFGGIIQNTSGAMSLTKTGSGTQTLNGANTYTGLTTVTQGTLQLGVPAQNVVIGAGAAGANIQGGATSTYGKVVMAYTGAGDDPATTVSGLLTTSYNGGVSPFAAGQLKDTTLAAGQLLGWADNAASKQVTILPTLPGDTNLDRAVTGTDLFKLLANFNQPGNWSKGDFNYDGSVTGADLFKLLANFNQSLPGEVVRGSAAGAVPEPGTLVLLATGLLGFLAYAWRRRR